MRLVPGFDRPVIQWTFVALAVVLVTLAALLSVAFVRLNGSVRELRAARIEERSAREQLEARVAREQATREALALELSRIRAGHPAADDRLPPTLTLQPLRKREPTPPQATMTAPPEAQVIELRLLLPREARRSSAPYELTVRDWVTGRVRLTRGGLTTSSSDGGLVVKAYVAGDVFASGSHEVILRDKESEVATYEVTVK